MRLVKNQRPTLRGPEFPPGLSANEHPPNDTLQNVSSPPPSYSSLTVKPMDLYHATVARMSGTENIGSPLRIAGAAAESRATTSLAGTLSGLRAPAASSRRMA